tara:strand:- start:1134 stop:1334 length:201 start_codon:yes stop_codon:yes gene_type:complete
MTSYEKFVNKYYSPLKGFTIKSFKLEGDEDNSFPTFILKKGNETIKISVSRDEEGNGGGFLFIEEA